MLLLGQLRCPTTKCQHVPEEESGTWTNAETSLQPIHTVRLRRKSFPLVSYRPTVSNSDHDDYVGFCKCMSGIFCSIDWIGGVIYRFELFVFQKIAVSIYGCSLTIIVKEHHMALDGNDFRSKFVWNSYWFGSWIIGGLKQIVASPIISQIIKTQNL